MARRYVPAPAGCPQTLPPPRVKGSRPFSKLDLAFPDSPGHQTVGSGYIYALVDPRDNTVRYVGYSRSPNLRYRQHEAADPGCNRGLITWEEGLVAARLAPRMIILTRAHDNWEVHERRWIAYYRRRGRLYNRHRGGRLSIEPQPDMSPRLKRRLAAIRAGVTQDARGRKP